MGHHKEEERNMQQFCGLTRGKTSLKVCDMPGRKKRYICVQDGNHLQAVARITGIAGEEAFLRALQYIALGTEGEE